MNSLEDRLRSAYQEATQTVSEENVRRLDMPPARPARPADRRLRVRRLAPLAAAAAVLAVIVAVVIAVAPGGSPGAGPGPAPVKGSATPPPPFFIGAVRRQGTADMGIYNARTGRMTDLVKLQKGFDFDGAAATSANRTFIVARTSLKGTCYTDFSRLTVSARGQAQIVETLAFPRIHGTLLSGSTSLAASANGQVIAYSANNCSGGNGWVSVVHLATQQIRTWPLDSEGLSSLSMSASGRTLDFVDTSSYGGDGTVRSLRTDAPVGPVRQRARIVLSASSGVDETGSAVLVGRGQTLLACREVGHEAILARYSAATGQETGLVHVWRHVDIAPCTVRVTPSGGDAIVTDIAPHGIGTRIRLATGQARLLPGSGPASADAPIGIAW